MLTQLNIRNLAVIDEVELEFSPGLTVLTGETGAGKSICVDALALALGERADSRAVRSDAERCEITAVFDLRARGDIRNWLRDNDLDEEEQDLIVRRVVGADGRSRGYINGRSVPMQTLRELGEQLVDICGQQSYQSLRHPGAQRSLLDDYGDHAELAEGMATAHAEWTDARRQLDELERADRTARLELLRHEVTELEALDPQPGELEELVRAQRLAANSGRITAGVMQALERTYEAEDAALHAQLSGTRRALEELAELDGELAAPAGLLAEAEILVAEAADAMRQRLGHLEHDPANEARIDRRLAGFHDLSRKHRVAGDELPEILTALSAELAGLESSDERIEALSTRTALSLERMTRIAAELTAARHEAAATLAAGVTDNMRTLGMPDGTFGVDVGPAQNDDNAVPGKHGADRVEFRTAVNAGQAAGPLSRVASGGELSRISLGLQVVAMATDAVPTLIFDEVDAGIGGAVAEIVGARLQELSADRQILCVTHLPQVASQANHHLHVTKRSDGKTTHTTVTPLGADARIEEIARMLGGVEITERSRAHAEEMLKTG